MKDTPLMEPAIERQMRELSRKLKKELAVLEKSRDSQAFVRAAVTLSKDVDHSRHSLLFMHFMLHGEYERAWMINHYYSWYRNMFKREQLLEHPSSWALKLYWEMADRTYDGEENYRRLRGGEKMLLEALPNQIFKPYDEQYNREALRRSTSTSSLEMEWLSRFDLTPEGRYKTIGSDRNYFVRYESFPENLRFFAYCLRLEDHASAQECLFRLKCIMSTGEPPRDWSDAPRLKYMAPKALAYEAWLLARLADSAERRMAYAWQAVYWLVEHSLRGLNTLHDDIDFEDNRMSSVNDTLCCVFGEFELAGERQAEFLANFKAIAQFASVSFCRRMIEDPVRIIPFPERNLPPLEDCKRLYDELYPPETK